MTHLKHTVLAAALITAAFQVPTLQARSCSGNNDVLGSYGYFGSRGSVFLIGATAPGTTAAGAPILIPTGGTTPPTTVTGSNTPYGRFVTGLANNGALSSNGRIYFDGTGSVYVAPASGSLLLNNLAGTYTVSTDCSIKITLNDPFVSTTTTTTTTTTASTVTLEGEVTANRIDAVVTGANAAGASVTFVRTSQVNSCSNANIQGNYTIVGSGFGMNSTTTTGGTTTGGTTTGGTTTGGTTTTTPGAFTTGANGTLGAPFSLLGRFTADGNGNLTPDPTQTPSPLKRTITGTYVVNVDCTGTAMLVDSAGITRNASFVLVNSDRCLSGPNSGNQSLQFVFTDNGFIGDAVASKQ
jgi:hypothetical protein